TEFSSNRIGTITLDGTVSEFLIPGSSSSFDRTDQITAGPDGNLWFIQNQGRIGRMTPNGILTRFVIPNADTLPGIAAGGSNVWLTTHSGNRLVALNIAGPIALAPVADGYVRAGTATANFGFANDLEIKRAANGDADGDREGYLMFDLSRMSRVTNARVRLFGHLQAPL